MAPLSSLTLEELLHFEVSSPDFPQQLENALREQDCEQYALNLGANDLIRLVDYLDKALDALGPTSPGFRVCSRRLGLICGTRTVLPTSYTSPSSLLSVARGCSVPGGHGEVHQGNLGGSMVRVKRMRVPFPKDAPMITKVFCEEAVTWKHLTHPNVLPLLGFTVSPPQLVSSWMPESLPSYIKKSPNADKIGPLSDVAEGLRYLHSCNVIHRQIKGSNVLVGAAGCARVTDFCLAVLPARMDDTLLDRLDYLAPRWSAPEVLNKGAYSKAADVFSFAMLMIEVFTGAIPFCDLRSLDAMVAIGEGRRPTRPAHPAITEGLWELIQHCWNHDPDSRPEAAEAAQILLAL